MPRHETFGNHDKRTGIGHEHVREEFNLRMDLPDGGILRGDGADLWMNEKGVSWRGTKPSQWDDDKAVEERFVCDFTFECDYS